MLSLKKYNIHIKGLTPFIMSSDRLVNPLDPMTKERKSISEIRKKQDNHYIALAKIEWLGALYYEEKLGLYIPSKILRGCLKSAAKKNRKMASTKAITFDAFLGTPIIGYEGITPETLWEKKNKDKQQIHVHATSVVIQRARVISTKPIIFDWATKFNIYLNEDILCEEKLTEIIETAGFEYGIGAERPERASGNYGQFSLESIKEIK